MEPSTLLSNNGGTRVAGGRHVVPRGVAVERFRDNGHKDLKEQCPEEVRALLEPKGLMPAYKKLISSFIHRGKRKVGKHSVWCDAKLVRILQDFKTEFASAGVKASLCIYNYYASTNSSNAMLVGSNSRNNEKPPSSSTKYRWLWLEFIDTTSTAGTVLSTYVSPYDVTSHKVVLDGKYMVPPTGVVVEALNDITPRQLVKKCPQDVKEFIDRRGIADIYDRFTKTLLDRAETRSWADTWKTSKVQEILEEGGFREEFARHEVQVVVCKYEMAEWEYLKWIEFIDRREVPEQNYWAIHDVDEDKVNRRTSIESSHGSFSSFARSTSLGLGEDEMDRAAVVEPLVVNGQPFLLGECPPNVEALLLRKDLVSEYPKLDVAISSAKNMRNFMDIWRMTGAGIIEYPPLLDFLSSFLEKGVKVILCESIGMGGKGHLWLEYIDTGATPDYVTPFDVCFDSVSSQTVRGEDGDPREYKKVAGGRHFVPEGVAVEELNEFAKVTDDCPEDVQELLTTKGLMTTYDEFIDALAKKKSTRGWVTNWKVSEISKIMQAFVEIFESKGVKMVLCKLKPNSGRSFRWFEYIDLAVAPVYVAQYDVSNYGDEELDTSKTTLTFPNGVAVEMLTDRKTIVEDTPASVRAMMEKKDCFDLYVALIDVLCESGSIDLGKGFSENQVRSIARILAPKFAAKGGT